MSRVVGPEAGQNGSFSARPENGPDLIPPRSQPWNGPRSATALRGAHTCSGIAFMPIRSTRRPETRRYGKYAFSCSQVGQKEAQVARRPLAELLHTSAMHHPGGPPGLPTASPHTPVWAECCPRGPHIRVHHLQHFVSLLIRGILTLSFFHGVPADSQPNVLKIFTAMSHGTLHAEKHADTAQSSDRHTIVR